jgi:hypothetical protein
MSEHPPAGIDDDTIREVVIRLARPRADGGHVIERAAILAAGGDATAIETWILAHDGRPEHAPARSTAGLHFRRDETLDGAGRSPRRFLLPPGALESVPNDLSS